MTFPANQIRYTVTEPYGSTVIFYGSENGPALFTPTQVGSHVVKAVRLIDGSSDTTNFLVTSVATIDITIEVNPTDTNIVTITALTASNGSPLTYPTKIDWGDGSLDNVPATPGNLPISHTYSTGANRRMVTAIDQSGLQGTVLIIGTGLGMPGDDGSQWFDGQGPPPDPFPFTDGKDYYLDTLTGDVYTVDIGAGGGGSSGSLAGPPGPAGPAGPAGPQGPRGSTWFSGTGPPSPPPTGWLPGDFYLDSSNGNIYTLP